MFYRLVLCLCSALFDCVVQIRGDICDSCAVKFSIKYGENVYGEVFPHIEFCSQRLVGLGWHRRLVQLAEHEKAVQGYARPPTWFRKRPCQSLASARRPSKQDRLVSANCLSSASVWCLQSESVASLLIAFLSRNMTHPRCDLRNNCILTYCPQSCARRFTQTFRVGPS